MAIDEHPVAPAYSPDTTLPSAESAAEENRALLLERMVTRVSGRLAGAVIMVLMATLPLELYRITGLTVAGVVLCLTWYAHLLAVNHRIHFNIAFLAEIRRSLGQTKLDDLGIELAGKFRYMNEYARDRMMRPLLRYEPLFVGLVYLALFAAALVILVK